VTVLQDRDARRESLLAAADLVVQRDGAAASMATIAAEAGITKPILYRHFGDKRGLYAALAERHTDRLLDDLVDALTAGGPPRERVARTIDAYLSVLEAEPQVYRFLVQSEEAALTAGSASPVRGFVHRLQELLAAGISHELRVPEDDTRSGVWAAAIVGMVQSAGERWLERRDLERAELGDLLTGLLWGAYGEATAAAQA
jgi:AcrR family transcriptional regulator